MYLCMGPKIHRLSFPLRLTKKLKLCSHVYNSQSNVQVALDFLCPESVGESARLAEEIRCLPNDHEAKLQILEVTKL